MKKLIYADDISERLERVIRIGAKADDGEHPISAESVLLVIKSLPAVDATIVRHGRWKAVKDGDDAYRRICSCCGVDAPYDESEGVYLLYPHCPWCGSLNDGKDGEQS